MARVDHLLRVVQGLVGALSLTVQSPVILPRRTPWGMKSEVLQGICTLSMNSEALAQTPLEL